MLEDTIIQESPALEIPETLTESSVETTPQAAPEYEWQQQMAMREQAYLQALASERQRSQQMEQAVVENAIQQAPQQQQEALRQWYAYTQYTQQLQQQNQQMAAYAQQLEQAVLPLVKNEVFKHLSDQHKVEKELLSLAETPREAEKIIKVIAEMRKKQAASERVNSKVDNVGASGGASVGGPSADAVMSKFKNSGKIADFIREKMKSGQW